MNCLASTAGWTQHFDYRRGIAISAMGERLERGARPESYSILGFYYCTTFLCTMLHARWIQSEFRSHQMSQAEGRRRARCKPNNAPAERLPTGIFNFSHRPINILTLKCDSACWFDAPFFLRRIAIEWNSFRFESRSVAKYEVAASRYRSPCDHSWAITAQSIFWEEKVSCV